MEFVIDDKIDHITFVFYPFGHGVIFCEICRLWLICYDINYLHSSLNNGWKSQINAKICSKNWWLKHRKTFGNYDYITRRFLIYGISSGLTILALYQIYGLQDWIALIDGVLYLIPLIFLMFMYCKCPKITKDDFYFQLEFKTSMIFFIIVLVTYFISGGVAVFDAFFAQIIQWIVGFIAFSFVSILSTLYIPRLIRSQKQWNDENLEMNTIGAHTQHLEKIFAKQRKFEAFALHLNNEFSLECLLSFIEMIQFKQYFDQIYNGNVNDEIIVEDLKVKFDFGKEQLRSSIVFETVSVKFENNDTEKLRSFKVIAHELYRKYINPGCELEVNISGISRSEYETLMHDKQEWVHNVDISSDDLYALFDDICLEMYQLMDQSFERFRRSDEYSSSFVSIESNSLMSNTSRDNL